jgi:hypothetical protein
MAIQKIKINRAPVLTLWAAVVAHRLGYDTDAALTLGKGVAGLNAQSKGRRLGIFEEGEAEKPKPKSASPETEPVTLLGRPVPVARTPKGLRATVKGKPITPDSVQKYLEQKFGEALPEVKAAFESLAKAYPPKQLETKAYDLYERFRPKIPEGTKGWGVAGELDLDYIRSLAK